jgi:hypothetical protein
MSGEGEFFNQLMNGNAVVTGDVRAGGAVTASGVVALTEATTLTAAQSGKLFTLGTAGGFTTTLPSPASGLKFKFVVKVAPTTAYIIASAGSANKIYGVVASAEDAAGSVAVAAASDTISFVASKALIGDTVEVISDGVNWYATGFCNVQDAVTLTQAT